ncbi:MAG: hypothetical protein HC810_06380 [Acaryochloridaceae cyanobacterium RL_2_7]|nr:hypothetical protein [Acaryochloridaceae cyanobacterium RL_2_7]
MGALTEIYGENYKFSTVSQDLTGEERTFDSFAQAGLEDALSRVYGGVHVREAGLDGFSAGFNIGEYITQNMLRPTDSSIYPDNLA